MISLKNFPQLKGIYRAGIGTDNVPLVEAEEKNIIVHFPSGKTKNIIYEETANFTCSSIFTMLHSKTGTVDPWQKESRSALETKCLLVIGMGNIGKRVYSKMKHFLDVDSFDILDNEITELNEKIRRADVITLHIPKIIANKSFFDRNKLARMKDNAILINTSRAMLVDEDALYYELKSARLRASFDVFWTEPYHGKMLEIPGEIFMKTPHVASNCFEYKSGCRQDLDAMITVLSKHS